MSCLKEALQVEPRRVAERGFVLRRDEEVVIAEEARRRVVDAVLDGHVVRRRDAALALWRWPRHVKGVDARERPLLKVLRRDLPPVALARATGAKRRLPRLAVARVDKGENHSSTTCLPGTTRTCAAHRAGDVAILERRLVGAPSVGEAGGLAPGDGDDAIIGRLRDDVDPRGPEPAVHLRNADEGAVGELDAHVYARAGAGDAHAPRPAVRTLSLAVVGRALFAKGGAEEQVPPDERLQRAGEGGVRVERHRVADEDQRPAAHRAAPGAHRVVAVPVGVAGASAGAAGVPVCAGVVGRREMGPAAAVRAERAPGELPHAAGRRALGLVAAAHVFAGAHLPRREVAGGGVEVRAGVLLAGCHQRVHRLVARARPVLERRLADRLDEGRRPLREPRLRQDCVVVGPPHAKLPDGQADHDDSRASRWKRSSPSQL
ncbi:hypothetical protein M885DRAFT_151194 [Pelagophyceae sp. CCMP2097]|nr:hypothetical protein M885DRAFT_151194 [Pelagophyceae sp. CCMP2097]